MLISALVLALAAQASPTAAPQRAFVDCLEDELVSALDDRVQPDAFAAALKTKCTDQEAAYRAAMVRADRGAGIAQKDADESAADEIAYWRDKFTAEYGDYFKDNARPGRR